MLINHILSEDDSKPLIASTQGPNLLAMDRPSHYSRPSYTQFDAMTPVTEMQINNRAQSTIKTTKIQTDEDRDK